MFQMDACALFLLGKEARDLCIPATDSIRKQFRYFDFPPCNESAVVVDPAAMNDAKVFSAFIENCSRFACYQDGVVFIYPPDYTYYENGVQKHFDMGPSPIFISKGSGFSSDAPIRYDIIRNYWCPPSASPAGAPQVRFLLSVRLGRGVVPRRQCSGLDLSVLWR